MVELAASGYTRVDRAGGVLFADTGEIEPSYLPGHAHAHTLSFELEIAGRRTSDCPGPMARESDVVSDARTLATRIRDVGAARALRSSRWVPSFLHEFLLEMFRKRAELAPELLRACAGIELEGDTVEISSGDLSQIAPAEFRADAVVVLRDRARVVTAAVIVEIQLHVDATKRRTLTRSQRSHAAYLQFQRW